MKNLEKINDEFIANGFNFNTIDDVFLKYVNIGKNTYKVSIEPKRKRVVCYTKNGKRWVRFVSINFLEEKTTQEIIYITETVLKAYDTPIIVEDTKITKNWLVDCGFVYEEDYYYLHLGNNFYLIVSIDKEVFYLTHGNSDTNYTHISKSDKSVPELFTIQKLQDFYFTITKRKLQRITINEDYRNALELAKKLTDAERELLFKTIKNLQIEE